MVVDQSLNMRSAFANCAERAEQSRTGSCSSVSAPSRILAPPYFRKRACRRSRVHHARRGRPDIALKRAGQPARAFVELKAPTKPGDPARYRDAHDKRQFVRFQSLPSGRFRISRACAFFNVMIRLHRLKLSGSRTQSRNNQRQSRAIDPQWRSGWLDQGVDASRPRQSAASE